MTVQELIDRLRLCPPGAQVLISLYPDVPGGAQGSGFGCAYDVVSPFADTCEIAARSYTTARPTGEIGLSHTIGVADEEG